MLMSRLFALIDLTIHLSESFLNRLEFVANIKFRVMNEFDILSVVLHDFTVLGQGVKNPETTLFITFGRVFVHADDNFVLLLVAIKLIKLNQ
jgi:hypothetical protein